MLSPIEWILIGAGVVAVGANFVLFAWLKADVKKATGSSFTQSKPRVSSDVHERLARIEGAMDILLQGIQIRVETKNRIESFSKGAPSRAVSERQE